MGLLVCPKDLALFESVNKEIPQLAGIPVDFFELIVIPSRVDPLYRQPVNEQGWQFIGPYTIDATVEKPVPAFIANDEGATREDKTRVTFSRALMEAAGMPYPKKGDLVRFWDITFTVVAAEDMGAFWQTGKMVNVVVDLIRHSEYVPENKIYPLLAHRAARTMQYQLLN